MLNDDDDDFYSHWHEFDAASSGICPETWYVLALCNVDDGGLIILQLEAQLPSGVSFSNGRETIFPSQE